MVAKDWWTIIIPASVTIIGFVVNYFTTKSGIKNEIKKQQGSIRLDKLLQCLEEYQETYRAILNSSKLNEKEKEKVITKQVYAFQKIMDYVYLYGSEDACRIAAEWQQYTYTKTNNDESNSIVPVCYSNLLIAQICLDVTGDCNNPSYYYRIKLTDFIEQKAEIEKIHNTIINELDLNDKLFFA